MSKNSHRKSSKNESIKKTTNIKKHKKKRNAANVLGRSLNTQGFIHIPPSNAGQQFGSKNEYFQSTRKIKTLGFNNPSDGFIKSRSKLNDVLKCKSSMFIFDNGNPVMNEMEQDHSDSNAKSPGMQNKLSVTDNNKSRKVNNS